MQWTNISLLGEGGVTAKRVRQQKHDFWQQTIVAYQKIVVIDYIM